MQSPLFANGRMGGCPQKTATKIATNWCMNRVKTLIYRGFSGFTNLHGVQEAVSSTLATRTKKKPRREAISGDFYVVFFIVYYSSFWD